ncbi:MAG: sporulation protein YqfD [Christensenellaceae bacterium]|nr:sporulation protein YqfD [Christensenellaceae bacterium]
MWNNLAGYVMIQMQGVGLERFVNRALREGLGLWGIRRTGPHTLTAYVSIGDFYALHRVKDLRCRIRILEKHGLPIALSRMRFRKVMAFGWVFVIAALLFASRFVWFVRVEGCDAVKEERVRAALAELGIQPGIRRGSITTGGLGQAVMAADSRISWAGAELYGVVLQVSIREADLAPDILAEGAPRSLYASKDGVIRRITPLAGKALFHAGDAVLKGQKLIGGNLDSGAFVHARGEVIARVLYRFSYTAAPEQMVLARNGQSTEYIEIRVMGKAIAPAASPYAQFEAVQTGARELRALLPVEVAHITFYQLTRQPRMLSQAQLAQIAAEGVHARMKTGVAADARVLSAQDEMIVEADGGVTVILSVIAEENIAQSGAAYND